MKVFGISGTPRAGGNSEVLLREAMNPFAEAGWAVELVPLSEKNIAPCTGCETCVETGKCGIEDDMQGIYRAYAACDALIISAPVYFRYVPAQLKAVFDRTHAVGGSRPLKGKPDGAMAVGRGQGGGQAIVLNGIHNFYLSCGALCVPGGAERPLRHRGQAGRYCAAAEASPSGAGIGRECTGHRAQGERINGISRPKNGRFCIL